MKRAHRLRQVVKAVNLSTGLGLLLAATAMIPLYGVCAGASMLLCGDWASYNPFERLAGLADGRYEPRPLRPALRRLRGRTS